MKCPKYKKGQMLKVTLDWAKDIQPQPVEDVVWDESWNCYTYSFPKSLIRIEEHDLEAA